MNTESVTLVDAPKPQTRTRSGRVIKPVQRWMPPEFDVADDETDSDDFRLESDEEDYQMEIEEEDENTGEKVKVVVRLDEPDTSDEEFIVSDSEPVELEELDSDDEEEESASTITESESESEEESESESSESEEEASESEEEEEEEDDDYVPVIRRIVAYEDEDEDIPDLIESDPEPEPEPKPEPEPQFEFKRPTTGTDRRKFIKISY